MLYLSSNDELKKLISDYNLVLVGIASGINADIVSLLQKMEATYSKYVKVCMAIPPKGLSIINKYQASVMPQVLFIGKDKYNHEEIVHARLVSSDISRDNILGLIAEYTDMLLK